MLEKLVTLVGDSLELRSAALEVEKDLRKIFFAHLQGQKPSGSSMGALAEAQKSSPNYPKGLPGFRGIRAVGEDCSAELDYREHGALKQVNIYDVYFIDT